MSLNGGSRGLNVSYGPTPIKGHLDEQARGSKPNLNFASRIHLVRLGTPSRNDARWVKSDA